MPSPMKMKYSGTTPKGVPALNKGKSSNETKAKSFGARSAGEYYKKPSVDAKAGKTGKDKSSSNNTMRSQSASDKNRYTQATQPVQYSNEYPGKTKFVC